MMLCRPTIPCLLVAALASALSLPASLEAQAVRTDPRHARHPVLRPGGGLAAQASQASTRQAPEQAPPLLVGQLLGYVEDDTEGAAPSRAVVEVLGYVDQQLDDPALAPPRPPEMPPFPNTTQTPRSRPPQASPRQAPPGRERSGNVPTPAIPPAPIADPQFEEQLDAATPGAIAPRASRPQSTAPDALDFDPSGLDGAASDDQFADLAFDATYSPLANAPWMFGDVFFPVGQQVLSDPEVTVTRPLTVAGGNRAVKVSENNKALPQDRVYFAFQHFESVFDYSAVSASGDFANFADRSMDRYTFAAEKTFLDGLWSLEIRAPLQRFPGGADASLIAKRLLYQSYWTSVVTGLGVTLPTGSDQGFLKNDFVNLLPYLGFLSAPNQRLFYQGFAQLDVPTVGGRMGPGGTREIREDDLVLIQYLPGTLSLQTLLYLDFSVGYWFVRKTPAESSSWLTGLASVLELHYLGTLNDADIVRTGFVETFGESVLGFTFSDDGNQANRQDILNLTVGVHAELGYKTSFRVGGVFPLRDGDDKTFDAEVQASLIQRF